MTIGDIQRRLVAHLLKRIRNGELSERALARLVGVSQPHLHHVLHGKRSLSIKTTDEIMHQLKMDIFDLIEPAEWPDASNRQ
jgi:transcriptional regulator with XRE-family HTH domain